MKTTIPLALIAVALLCPAAAIPKAQAVSPPPDGGYPNFNTAEGQNALLSLTTGAANTAVGWSSLLSTTTGSFNTAIGVGALLFNTADANTAFGAAALLFNTTGTDNTAIGTAALLNNDTGNWNTAVGDTALHNNIDGNHNTANGALALFSNTAGFSNTAIGATALEFNTEGHENTAVGLNALFSNDTGNFNTATGVNALLANTEGVSNSALGWGALLLNQTGTNNTAIGVRAGENITGSSNICIGSQVFGVAGENNTIRIGDSLPNGSACYIGGIFQALVVGGDAVICNSAGKVGTGTSSKRFKEAIKPMDRASEVLLSLTPVTFRYKKELDPTGTPQFGLVAEEVEKVNPDLVVHNKDGKPHSVRYDQISAMLLNEFLKEHRKVQKLEAALDAVTARLNNQERQLQKVSALVETSKAPRQVATRD